MTQGVIDFVEPDRKKKTFKKQQYAVKPEDIAHVGRQIEESWEGIQKHEFTTLCENEYCYWCDFVRNEYVFVEGSEMDYEREMDEMG